MFIKLFFFQDYKENMMKHRDNKEHVEWDLESTCGFLHSSFPNHSILVIRPSKMSLMTFSCFENFVTVNNFGAPTYSLTIDSLKHLQALLFSVETILKNDSKFPDLNQNAPITLIGFSKGCVVMNQFLYSFLALKNEPVDDLVSFISRIGDMYWLEGGHSGAAETWVTNRAVLENFASMGKKVHIHVTPYQVFCDTRPRIGKEEKIFRDILMRLGCDVNRVLHFEDLPRSVQNHFQILLTFKSPSF